VNSGVCLKINVGKGTNVFFLSYLNYFFSNSQFCFILKQYSKHKNILGIFFHKLVECLPGFLNTIFSFTAVTKLNAAWEMEVWCWAAWQPIVPNNSLNLQKSHPLGSPLSCWAITSAERMSPSAIYIHIEGMCKTVMNTFETNYYARHCKDKFS
jgi:hypothetical protein